jgi:hypothetical protein
VECYLDAVYGGADWSLPLEAEEVCPFCCKSLEDCDCPEDIAPLGVPCPGDAFVPF